MAKFITFGLNGLQGDSISINPEYVIAVARRIGYPNETEVYMAGHIGMSDGPQEGPTNLIIVDSDYPTTLARLFKESE